MRKFYLVAFLAVFGGLFLLAFSGCESEAMDACVRMCAPRPVKQFRRTPADGITCACDEPPRADGGAR